MQFSVDDIFYELIHVFYGKNVRRDDRDPFIGEQESVDDAVMAASPDIQEDVSRLQLFDMSEKFFLLSEPDIVCCESQYTGGFTRRGTAAT